MVFNSISFIIFFIVIAVLLSLTNLHSVKKQCGKHLLRIRHIILLIASYIFYGWWDWRFAFLMLALTATAYSCSLMLVKTKNKLYVCIAVIIPLIVLGIFKYFNFFVDSFVKLFNIEYIGALNIILPVGISFYTFQSLSYTLDVYRNEIKVERDFIKVALYIAFFPQLVAGPIVKANDFIPQLYEPRNINLRNFEKGIQYFVCGLFKKIVIADNISIFVDSVFSTPGNYHAFSLLLAVVGYSIQIYFDFSGYSDMAIGCSKCLGYDLAKNFNLPYISKNVSEFWKRWHISLSTWLMEYLYFPLGGNRRGTVRTYINLLLTMVIGGLWHGASWTFVVWGALHGFALCFHKLWCKLTGHDKYYKGTLLGNIVSTVITYAFVLLCWIYFRATDFNIANSVIRGILTWQSGVFYISSWAIIGIIVLALSTIVAITRSAKNKTPVTSFYPTLNLSTVFGLTILFVAIGVILGLAYTGGSPFIYFQF